MGVSVKLVSNGITKQLEGYLKRANALEGYLSRVVVQQYRDAQRARWMTENASEGSQWHRLSPSYEAYKKKAYKSYEGAGTKMLIATGKLRKSVIGPGEGFRMVTTPRSLTISTSVEYARHVDEDRTFTTYSAGTLRKIRDGIVRFLIKNEIRMPRAF